MRDTACGAGRLRGEGSGPEGQGPGSRGQSCVPFGEMLRNWCLSAPCLRRLPGGTMSNHLTLYVFVSLSSPQISPVQYLQSQYKEEQYQDIRKLLGRFGLKGHAHEIPISQVRISSTCHTPLIGASSGLPGLDWSPEAELTPPAAALWHSRGGLNPRLRVSPAPFSPPSWSSNIARQALS